MFKIKNRVLYNWLSEVHSKVKEKGLIEIIRNAHVNLSEANLVIIKERLCRVFLPHLKKKMKGCKYRKEEFEKLHSVFLENDFTVDLENREDKENCGKVTRKNCARERTQSLSYLDSSVREKQRRVKRLSDNYSLVELEKALKKRKSFEKKNPSCKSNVTNVSAKSVEATNLDLAEYMNGDYTKRKWITTRRYHKLRDKNVKMPSYEKIRQLKETCYPDNKFFKVTSSGASVSTQALLDHTAERILSLIDHQKIKSLKGKYLALTFKAGMDGSANQRQYQQKLPDNEKGDNGGNSEDECEEGDSDVNLEDSVDEHSAESVDEYSDKSDSDNSSCSLVDSDNSGDESDDCANENINVGDGQDELVTNNLQRQIDFSSIFIVSCVPLALTLLKKRSIWKNPEPSSIRYCRPLMFEFMTENNENMTKTYEFYINEFNNLKPKKIPVGDGYVTINYEVEFTMIDGKTCNICNASPTEMNDLKKIKKKEEENKFQTEFYKYGMSTLHCKIRFMEAILTMAYNKPFEKNRCSKAYRQQKSDRKKEIQTQLKDEIGILVDVVKQGFGTTNCGNTARRFFDPKNISTVARILNIDKSLIHQLSVILEVISSDKKIKIDRFENYCNATAQLWVKLYPWKYMTPTVHKVLIHGSAIIQELGCNIGRFSEEAQEANNKIFREARARKARGISAVACNTDVMLHLLVSSDVVISTLRQSLMSGRKKDKKHSAEALKLFCKK